MEQGKVLAAAITGQPGPAFAGAAPAAKLKIMGVEIFSAGSIDESEPGIEMVRYEDPSLGIYKKLLLKDNRLRGVILVGDITDERRYTQWLREETDLARTAVTCCSRRPPPTRAWKLQRCRTAK